MQLEYRIMSIKQQLGVSCIGWPIVDYRDISEVSKHFIAVKSIVNCLEIPFIPYDWLSRLQELVEQNEINVYSMHLPKNIIGESAAVQNYLCQVIRRAVNMLHIKHLVVHPWDGEAENRQITHLIDRLSLMNVDFSFEMTNKQFLKQLNDYLKSDRAGLTIDAGHYIRLFGGDMSYLKGLPITHIHLRGYSPDIKYARLSMSGDMVDSLIRIVQQKGYTGKFILEYPYDNYGLVEEDLRSVQQMCRPVIPGEIPQSEDPSARRRRGAMGLLC